MKFIILMLSVLLSASCTSTTTSQTVNSSDEKPNEVSPEGSVVNKLDQALALALKNNDYRLLVTSGRSMSIPGVDSSDYEATIKLCGKKYMSAAGDVITSQTQRMERKELINYMRQYNEQMLILCQK